MNPTKLEIWSTSKKRQTFQNFESKMSKFLKNQFQKRQTKKSIEKNPSFHLFCKIIVFIFCSVCLLRWQQAINFVCSTEKMKINKLKCKVMKLLGKQTNKAKAVATLQKKRNLSIIFEPMKCEVRSLERLFPFKLKFTTFIMCQDMEQWNIHWMPYKKFNFNWNQLYISWMQSIFIYPHQTEWFINWNTFFCCLIISLDERRFFFRLVNCCRNYSLLKGSFWNGIFWKSIEFY